MKTLNFTAVIGHVKTANGYVALESQGSINIPTYQVAEIRCKSSASSELLAKWKEDHGF